MQDDPVYIIGAGHTRFGKLEENLEELIISASKEALDDAKLSAGEIDAVFLGQFNSGLVPDTFASSLIHQAAPELRFKPATRCENACASGASAIFSAIHAIRAGTAHNVLVVGAEKMTHRSADDVTRALAGAGYQNDPNEAGLSFPQIFARITDLYAQRSGDPLPTMAQIAVKNHANALRNPLAQMHRPLDFKACMNASEKNPIIAHPLRLTDCSLVTDGAAAIVLSSKSASESAGKRVRVRGNVHVSDFLPMSRRDVLAMEGPRRAISGAYEQAGVTVADLDFAEVHDCFTIAELLIYEAMELAPAGKGREAIDSGAVLRSGRTPVNLSGGLKAKGHPVGATGVSMHAISFRQLTGAAGDMQLEVPPEFSLVFNMGGLAVANYASILQADRA